MTREEFQRYVDAFNANDFDGFSSFYAEDVEFNLRDSKRIVGRQGIIDFYTRVRAHINEKIEILDLVIGEDGLAMHNRTTFTTHKDWPDFELWPTMRGDVRTVESIIMYKIADGKFTDIKSARFKQLS